MSHWSSVTRGWPSPPTEKQSPRACSSSIDSSITTVNRSRGALVVALASANRSGMINLDLIGGSLSQADASNPARNAANRSGLDVKRNHGALPVHRDRQPSRPECQSVRWTWLSRWDGGIDPRGPRTERRRNQQPGQTRSAPGEATRELRDAGHSIGVGGCHLMRTS